MIFCSKSAGIVDPIWFTLNCYILISFYVYLQLESGLGQSESFYSWTLAVFNLGSLVGAILTGFIVQCIPYWYLILLGLILHTVGYIIYAVTYVGWLIMISKFMSGYFLGAQVTLALSYASKSSLEYVEVLREMEKKPDEGTAMRVRNYIFALQAIGISLGLLLGPGKHACHTNNVI